MGDKDKYKVRYTFVGTDNKKHRGAEIVEAEDYQDAYFKVCGMYENKYDEFEITTMTLLYDIIVIK